MIVLITSKYPYKDGEPFLVDEIKVAGKLSKHLVIYPLSNTCNEVVHALPSGIEAVNINKKHCLGTAVGCFIRSLLDPMLLRDVKEIVKQGVSFKKIRNAYYYSYKTNYYCTLVYRDLKRRISHDEEVVLYSYWMHFHACVAARLKKKFSEATFITRCHGFDLYEFRSPTRYLPGRDLVFRNADIIASVSLAGLNYLKQKYCFVKDKLVVSYLGTYDFGMNEYSKDTIRIISCSNLVEVKRVNLIIEALSKIEDISITWTHYGDGPLLEKLENQAKTELPENIQYSFKGFVENNQLMTDYKSTPISFFLNVSESEGLPVSIMEAMSFGIPVIATDVGGTSEIVCDKYNGYLINSSVSAEELKTSILDFISQDDDTTINMRQNARKTWETTFNAEKNYNFFYSTVCREG